MPQGSLSHKEGCQCRFCKLRRGEPVPPIVRKKKPILPPMVKDEVSAGAPTQRQLSENTDKVLEHFEYTLNETDVAIWKTDASASPVNPPKKIVEKYPEFEFKLGSIRKLEERGEGNGGWVILKDAALGYPDGVKRAGDSIFLVRPKTLGERIRQAKEEAAEGQIRGASTNRQAEMERRELSGDPTVITSLRRGLVQNRMAGLGVIVGRSALRAARERQQGGDKKYFDMGGRR